MKCATNFCRGKATKSGHSKFCAKCRSCRFKEKFPLKFSFNALKQRAKERGKNFEISFEQYEKWCVETGYDKLKGKTKLSLSINRKNANLGYVLDNIEAVTLKENSRLRWADIPAYVRAEMEAVHGNGRGTCA